MTPEQVESAAQAGAYRGALLAQATIAAIRGDTVPIARAALAMGVSEPTARKRTLHMREAGKLPAAAVLRHIAQMA